MSAAPMRWRVRAAAAADWAGLCTPDGHEAAPPAGAEAAWVAEEADPAPGEGRRAALALRRQAGRPVPQAWFRLGWAVHASDELGLYRRQRTLLLGHDLTGADELTGFAATPGLAGDAAAEAWGALLRTALQACAAAPGDGEAPPCIAQLPGLRDAQGRSPVWQGLGRHFHAQDLDAARRQHGPDWERHVAPLLPRHLLYTSLLPEPAQAALGRPVAAAQPLWQALLEAGFGWRGHVGIADGGPVLERWPPGR